MHRTLKRTRPLAGGRSFGKAVGETAAGLYIVGAPFAAGFAIGILIIRLVAAGLAQ